MYEQTDTMSRVPLNKKNTANDYAGISHDFLQGFLYEHIYACAKHVTKTSEEYVTYVRNMY